MKTIKLLVAVLLMITFTPIVTAIAESEVEIGDIITFGTYEQNGNIEDGNEAIEWQIVDINEGRALCLSVYCLDNKCFNDEKTDITWEDCTLRSWLNTDFYSVAFSEEERTRIVPIELNNDWGNSTIDNVFILSAEEVESYFDIVDGICANLTSKPTNYAKSQGSWAYSYASDEFKDKRGMEYASYDGNGEWLLRTPGKERSEVSFVSYAGGLFVPGRNDVNNALCIRPSITVKLSTLNDVDTTNALNEGDMAVAEGIDLSQLSWDELVTLNKEINCELMSRPEFKEVTVPEGVYKVGEDIPAGKWTISGFKGSGIVYWGKSIDEYGVEIPRGERIADFTHWDEEGSIDWNLVDGTYVAVTISPVKFTPYISVGLGF